MGDIRTETLAIGSGTLLCSLVESWLSADLGPLRVLLTEDEPAVRLRLKQLQGSSPISRIASGSDANWREVVRDFGTVLYASPFGNIAELRRLRADCRQEGVPFIPAIFWGDRGLAGPLALPDDDRCWESAWRQLHRGALESRIERSRIEERADDNATLLADIAVLGALQLRAGAAEPLLRGRLFVLDLATGEGDYHAFVPHPLANGQPIIDWLEPAELADAARDKGAAVSLPDVRTLLTSPVTGLFHLWEEGDLPQLPLSQCKAVLIDPLSEGPADLLPEEIGAGLTHLEARREAGLIGLECYAARLAERMASPPEAPPGGNALQAPRFFGIGAGDSYAEALCRGLARCLNLALDRRLGGRGLGFREAHIEPVDDRGCRFYYEALEIMRGTPPRIGIANLGGFPVAWVGFEESGGFASAGLHATLALRCALSAALQSEQNGAAAHPHRTTTAVRMKKPALAGSPEPLAVASFEEPEYEERWQASVRVLERSGMRLQAADLGRGWFGGRFPAKIAGIALRGGGLE